MFMGYTPHLATGVWVGYPDALISMTSVHGISVAGGTFPAQIWHDFMEVALDGHCETFPEPDDPVEWIPFHGEYTSSSGSGCSDGLGRRHRQLRGLLRLRQLRRQQLPRTAATGGNDDGAYAPGVGQKPAPKPDPAPKPEPAPPPPPPPPPPSGGVTPVAR